MTALECNVTLSACLRSPGQRLFNGTQISKDGRILCTDMNAQCEYWAASGQCEQNPYWMEPNCARSCDNCEQFLAAARQLIKDKLGRYKLLALGLE